jgi:hypothetical protein
LLGVGLPGGAGLLPGGAGLLAGCWPSPPLKTLLSLCNSRDSSNSFLSMMEWPS